MKNYGRQLSFILVLSIFLSLPALDRKASAQNSLPAFKDLKLSLERRVDDLVSRMTLEEKISQMQNAAAAVPRLDVPEYEWWNEGLHGVARAGIATVFP